jgi:hypothetical protein
MSQWASKVTERDNGSLQSTKHLVDKMNRCEVCILYWPVHTHFSTYSMWIIFRDWAETWLENEELLKWHLISPEHEDIKKLQLIGSKRNKQEDIEWCLLANIEKVMVHVQYNNRWIRSGHIENPIQVSPGWHVDHLAQSWTSRRARPTSTAWQMTIVNGRGSQKSRTIVRTDHNRG